MEKRSIEICTLFLDIVQKEQQDGRQIEDRLALFGEKVTHVAIITPIFSENVAKRSPSSPQFVANCSPNSQINCQISWVKFQGHWIVAGILNKSR